MAATEIRPTVLIRGACTQDAGAISVLISSLARYFLADPKDPGAATAFFQTITPDAIAQSLTGDRFRYHVAETSGELVGVVGIRESAHLYHLFVAEAFQGRGIAAELWGIASREVLADGNPGRFTVNSSLYARALYERLGFVATGEPQVKDGIAFVPMELVRSS